MTRDDDYREHAGVVIWPARRAFLTATDLCPACFAPLTSPECSNCGLDLRHPAATELLAASKAADRALSERVEIIGRIRIDSAAAERRRASEIADREAAMAERIRLERSIGPIAPAQTFDKMRPTGPEPTPRVNEPRRPSAVAPPDGADTPAAPVPAPPPRRSSVQVVLLIVGVSLLSIGAIAFLVYAFVNYGIVWRSVIIGAVTIAAFLVASALQRRALHATAEGIAAFAVVLVYLDAFAIRANDLFGAAAVDVSLYWGISLVVSAVAFIGWHRVSALRVPSIAGFAAFAPGVGFVVAGLTQEVSGIVATCLVGGAVAVAGVIHPLAGSRADRGSPRTGGGIERGIVLSISVAALVVTTLGAPFIAEPLASENPRPTDAVPAVLALLAAAAIAALHVLVLARLPVRTGNTGPWATAFTVILSLSVASIGFAIAGYGRSGGPYQVLPVLIATVVALVVEAAARTLPSTFLRARARPAWWVAAAVAVIGFVIPLVTSAFTLSEVLDRALRRPWSVPVDAFIVFPDGDRAVAAPALVAVGVVALVAWRVSGVLRRRATALGWYGAVALPLAVPAIGLLWAVLAGWLILAVAALVYLLRTRATAEPPRILRAPATALLVAATVLVYVVGWTGLETWAAVGVAVIALLLISRVIVSDPRARAALLSAATVVLLFGVASAGRQLTFASDPSPLAWTTDPVRFAGIAAVGVLGGFAMLALRSARLSTQDTRALFWITSTSAVLAAGWTQFAPLPRPSLLAEPITGLAVDAVLLVALLLWLRPSFGKLFGTEHRAASVLIAPAAWLMVDSVVGVSDLPDPLRFAAPVAAALVVGAVSVTVRLTRITFASAFLDIGVTAQVVAAVLVVLAAESESAWLVLALAAVTLLLVSIGRSDERMSAALVGAVTLSAICAAAAAAGRLAPAVGRLDDARLAQVAAIFLLTVSAAPLGLVGSALDRRTVFWFSLAAITITEASTRFAAVPSELLSTPVSLVIRSVLLVGLLLWVAAPSTSRFRWERVAASIAVGPAVYLVVDAFVRILELPGLLESVAPITSALLTAAGSLAITLLRPSSRTTRRFREIGVAIVGVPALIASLLFASEDAWLALLLGAVAVLLIATSADGVFASSAPRRHFGWGALALAVAGLWWRLADDAVTAIEPYTLPVAGLVLLVALLTHRGSRIRVERWRSTTAGLSPHASRPDVASAVIFFAGLLVAILPVAALSTSGLPGRAIAIGSASALLLLVGSLVPIRSAGASAGIRPFLDAAALAGGVGVLVTTVGRAGVLVAERPENSELDAWLLGGLVLLVIAAFGLASTSDDRFLRQRSLAAQVIAFLALGGVLVIESVAIWTADEGILRPMGIVLLFCAVHVIGFIIDRTPFTRAVSWLAICSAVVIATVGVASGSLDPLEAGTVPIALSLIATGTVQLDRDRMARSWGWLAPGVTVLLLPSLIATIEDRPLWRLVGIGVVGVVTVVIAVARRLQAPFVIASVLVVIHATATFAPQIRATYEAVAWWLWLVIGGIILIVLAARYEQRLKNLREAVHRIGSLR